MKRARGAALVESVLLLPVVLGLLIGTVELARVTYTYYMLEKLMYNLARYLGNQQGGNFCDSQDAAVQSAINYSLTGDPTTFQNPIIPRLTPSMFLIRAERYDSNSQQMVPCDCTAPGCDASQGGQPPG